MDSASLTRLSAAIRDVKDFPSKGILFKDIMPVIADGALFRLTIDAIMETLPGSDLQKIMGIDARGFIFAGAVADRIGAGFIPVRKKGKLPWQTISTAYDLEYGSNTIEMHDDALRQGERVWLVDDVLATGGTSAAAAKLVGMLGGNLAGMTFLVELESLRGRDKLPAGIPVFSILKYR